MADSAIAITALTAVGGDGQITVNLTVGGGACLGYLALDKFEIWSAPSNDRAAATKVGETAGVQFVHAGLGLVVTRYHWARARDVSGNLGDFFPVSPTGGIVATTKQKELVPGSVGTSEIADESVTTSKYARLSIGEAQIASAAITNAKIGNLQVDNAKIANLTVGGEKVQNYAISSPVIYADYGGISVQNGLGNVFVAGAYKSPNNPLGRVEVTFTASLYAAWNASNNWGSFLATLYRNGSPVADCVARPDDENQDGLVVIRYIDTAPTPASWEVRVQYISSPGPGAGIACRNRYLSVVEFSK